MSRLWICVLVLALSSLTAHADPFLIDFEGIADSTSAATLFAAQGVTFSSGIVVVSGAFGGTLNELDFPPLIPGQGVFLNDADVTSLFFSGGILSFSGSFTYGGPITLNFFGPDNTLQTTLTSAFSTNIGT